MLLRTTWFALLAAAVVLQAGLAAAQTDFITFESGPVRPVALSPDESRLFVTNIPDGHLEVFDLSDRVNPVQIASIPVGLEPVAVVALSNDEAWVVNHLSDSVSIVSVSAGRVVRTLLVGDEPRDIVLADPPGPVGPRVFVSTAHRGQHRTDASIAAVPGAGDPQLTTAGVGRADVWVFDPSSLGGTLGGTPIEILTFFSDTPRALAVSPDGSHVYVAGFHSGNQTTTVSEGVVCNGFGGSQCAGDGITSPGGLAGGNLPGGMLGPVDNADGVDAPEVGIIVQWDEAAGEFQDESGRNWTNGVRFTLPDKDVFAIDAATLGEVAFHSHVGTILFNMAVHPDSGKLYVSNTDANNLTRFEGPGTHGGTTVQGNLAKSRITVIASPDSGASTVEPIHLNKHIPYATLPAPAGVKADSLATPLDMAIYYDGNDLSSTLYVAAFGSSKIGIFDADELEADTFTPDDGDHIDVSGGGPSGLAMTSDGKILYTLTRFDNGISVVSTTSRNELLHLTLHNPEPSEVVTGRPHLYDAFDTSSNGEASCSSCHVFGDMDDLAWDLGNPDEEVSDNPIPINFGDVLFIVGNGLNLNGGADDDQFHPMKGPMTTQTLRGMVNSGAMHWRGDRSNGAFGVDATDSDLSFRNFIVAFSGLLGRNGNLSGPAMQEFSDFALAITLPPNPVRALDNSLNADEQAGANFYDGARRSDGLANDQFGLTLGFTCEGCHELDASQGFFGTGTNASFENETQIVKIPHLRNLYQKVGMFGMPHVDFELAGDNGFKGDQIRGFGFLHDGSTDTLLRFFRATVFNGQQDASTGFTNETERQQMEAFMLAFDSDLAPIVGQQITRTATNGATVDPRIDLLIQRADASFTSEILGLGVTECDLIAKGTVGATAMGWVYTGGGVGAGTFDAADGSSTTDAALRALSASTDITFTCVPPGSGVRAGINRDRDNHLDANDNCPAVANNDQLDTDGDQIGDPCDPTPVPEPGTLVMLTAGLVMLRGMARRRRA